MVVDAAGVIQVAHLEELMAAERDSTWNTVLRVVSGNSWSC
ncbi:MAG: hypothetical protein HW389_1798 [Bacteroidetes bacterium]|nr:hypothetical protein [Bacteroidota bacterium]MBM2840197.1 hypothetical protein [Bacteroidota bacterium]